MISPWFDLVVFLIAGLTFPLVNIGISALLRRNYPYPEKLLPYESGEDPLGDARVRFRVSYYFFAMIFLVFDVETVFLYPWAVVFRELGMFALIEMVVFVAVLAVGLLYAYKKRVLRWT
ncbi:MAG TPA: NADH-quinone oxidoreductase subunit A [Bacillota bacterium]